MSLSQFLAFAVSVINDRDGDGVTRNVDCDDRNNTVHPGAFETPNDGIDQDCDGRDLAVQRLISWLDSPSGVSAVATGQQNVNLGTWGLLNFIAGDQVTVMEMTLRVRVSENPDDRYPTWVNNLGTTYVSDCVLVDVATGAVVSDPENPDSNGQLTRRTPLPVNLRF